MSSKEPRPQGCCGKCPPIEGGGYDCTCIGNEKCVKDLISAARNELAVLNDPYGMIDHLANVLEATVREMHARELHHFETEEKLANAKVQALLEAAEEVESRNAFSISMFSFTLNEVSISPPGYETYGQAYAAIIRERAARIQQGEIE